MFSTSWRSCSQGGGPVVKSSASCASQFAQFPGANFRTAFSTLCELNAPPRSLYLVNELSNAVFARANFVADHSPKAIGAVCNSPFDEFEKLVLRFCMKGDIGTNTIRVLKQGGLAKVAENFQAATDGKKYLTQRSRRL
jgi:hypothetical protein